MLSPYQKAGLVISRSIVNLANRSTRLLILIYHRVFAEADPFWDGDLDAKTFDWHMQTLSRNFNVLPLYKAVEYLKAGNLPANSVCVTFDDGYADNHDVALPILLKYKIPATFFIAVGFIDGGRMWNDTIIESVRVATGKLLDLNNLDIGKFRIDKLEERRQALYAILDKVKYLPLEARIEKANQIAETIRAELPVDLMMSSKQVKAMRASGMEIGGHTINHPILSQVPIDVAEKEIVVGKEQLEKMIGEPVKSFAFPNGRPGRDYNETHVEMVKRAGFNYSVSTAWGVAGKRDDFYQLPRVSPWDETPFRFALRLQTTRLAKKAERV